MNLAIATTHADKADDKTCREKLDLFRAATKQRFSESHPEQETVLQKKYDELEQLFGNVASCDPEKCFASLLETAKSLDNQSNKSCEYKYH